NAGIWMTGPIDVIGVILLLYLGGIHLHRLCVTPFPYRASRGWWLLREFWGSVRRPVKGKIQWAGSRRSLGRYILGTRRSVSLASGRGATMLATLHEFLVEGDALLAHGTLLGRIRREIPAHEAEDLLAGDLGLLRPAPQ